MPGQVAKYASVQAGQRLHQGEILAGLVQVRQALATIGEQNVRIDEIAHPYVIVLTQDCDLEQDFAARAAGDATRMIANVLVCEAVPTTELKTKVPPGKDIWKRLIQNKDERYHCIEAAPSSQDTAGQGIPSLGCDFKRFFTVLTDELYKRINLQQVTQRSRLLTPYAEQLLHRFCNFQARIPLPENHDVPLQ